jgi:hypothetical protein
MRPCHVHATMPRACDHAPVHVASPPHTTFSLHAQGCWMCPVCSIRSASRRQDIPEWRYPPRAGPAMMKRARQGRTVSCTDAAPGRAGVAQAARKRKRSSCGDCGAPAPHSCSCAGAATPPKSHTAAAAGNSALLATRTTVPPACGPDSGAAVAAAETCVGATSHSASARAALLGTAAAAGARIMDCCS